MLRKYWALIQSPGALAMALVLGMPWLAQAQQGGLFPLAPITRQRPPCPMEDPVYELYRHQYFGYFPTCWRQFPAGWGCPSPDAPNVARAFALKPRTNKPDLTPEGEEPDQPPSDGMRGGDPDAEPENPGRSAPDSKLPLPPPDRSPFDLDMKATSPNSASLSPKKPSTGVRTAPTSAPAPTQAPGNGNMSAPPLEFAPARPVAPPSTNSALPPISRNNIPATAPAPSPSIPSTGTNSANSGSLMPLPDVGVPTVSSAAPVYNSLPPAAEVIEADPSALPPSQPVQAPRRTSFLGNLFGGFGRSRR